MTEQELNNIADLAARAKQELLLSEAHKENYQRLKKELSDVLH